MIDGRRTSHGISAKLGQKVGSGVDLQMPRKNVGGPPQIWGAKKQILDHFSHNFRTRKRISAEWNVASTNKNASVNLQ